MFVRRKVAKNKDGSIREYLQIVESRRINGQPRHVVLLTLGNIRDEKVAKMRDDLITTLAATSEKIEILNLEKDLCADWSKSWGLGLVFERLWKESGLRAIFEFEVKDLEVEFGIEQAIFNMVLNRLSQPCSKRALGLWEEESYNLPHFELHQYYRAMDYLIEKKESLEQRVFAQMRDLFCQSLDIVFFDTTSLVYFGEEDPEAKRIRDLKREQKKSKNKTEDSVAKDQESAPLLARGFSKDHRSDLPQIVVGVLMSKEGIPLAHEVFPGNTNDVSCFQEIITQVSKKYPIGKVILVGDRGMICQKNLDFLHEKNLQYILGYRMRTIPKKDRYWVLTKADLKKVRRDLQWKEVRYNDQRLLVCYNPERAILDAEKREDILDRIRKKIKDGSILSIIDNANYKKFLTIKGQVPKIDPEAIERDAAYDGMYVLTSNTKLAGGQIIETYKGLWQVEHAFRNLKTELEMGPVYHWKDDRIRAHVMICFLALVLRTIFYKKLRAEDPKVSYQEVFSSLKSLEAVGLKFKNKSVVLRTEPKEKALVAFRALKMSAPPRIVSTETIPE
jgi:transposase